MAGGRPLCNNGTSSSYFVPRGYLCDRKKSSLLSRGTSYPVALVRNRGRVRHHSGIWTSGAVVARDTHVSTRASGWLGSLSP